MSSPDDTSVPLGTDANFFCSVMVSSSTDEVAITWTGPEITSVDSTSQSLMMADTLVTGQLTISVTDISQAGPYFCTASYMTCTGSTSSDPAMLSILPPSVTIDPMSVDVVTPPMNIMIDCNASPQIQSIIWTGPVTDFGQMTDDPLTVSTLTVNIADVTYGGEYICTATNAAGPTTSSVIIYVRPEVTPSAPLTSENGPATLMCIVQMDPLGTIRWEKMDGPDSFVVVDDETDKSLTFASIQFGDEGTYRCVVTTSEFGEQPSTTALITGMENMCLFYDASIDYAN